MKIKFEIVSGCEGNCLCVEDIPNVSSTRLAGYKPWGGGTVTETFTVNVDELERAIARFKKSVYNE